MRPLFLVGAQRSGATALGHLLSAAGMGSAAALIWARLRSEENLGGDDRGPVRHDTRKDDGNVTSAH